MDLILSSKVLFLKFETLFYYFLNTISKKLGLAKIDIYVPQQQPLISKRNQV